MTSLPPKCSASVTTPSGIDIQALMRGAAFCSSGSRSIRTSSVDPPPISNRMAPRPLRIEQRRAADHGERRFGLAIDHLKPDAGLGGDPVPKTVGIRRRAAGFGRDQPQALGLSGVDLVAANAERGDGAFDRGVADAAGRRDALAEPDDPRERIDHAKSVAGRTGDQQPAIIGAKVERRVDAGSRGRRGRARPRSRCAAPGPRRCAAFGLRLRAARGRREAACPHPFKMSFRGPSGPTRNFRSRKL